MTEHGYEQFTNWLATFFSPASLSKMFGPPEVFNRPYSAVQFITVDEGLNVIKVDESTSVLFINVANPDDDSGPVEVMIPHYYMGRFSNGPVWSELFYRGGLADDIVSLTIEGGGEVPNGTFHLGDGNNILSIAIDATSADIGTLDDIRGFSLHVDSGGGDDIVDIDIVGPESQQSVGISEQFTFATPVSVDINTGAGDDQVMLLSELAIYNNYRAFVDTGAGNDIVDFSFKATVDGASGGLGGGKVNVQDLMITKYVDTGDGSDISTTDLSIVLPTPNVDDGARDVFVHISAVERAGAGDDVISWALDLSAQSDAKVRLTGLTRIDGGDGNDDIFGRLALENVFVSNYNFSIDGGAGDDRIDFGIEAVLSGQVEFDVLANIWGGSGFDTFVATKGQTSGTIGDFMIGEDVLFLAGIFSEADFDVTTITRSEIGPEIIVGNVSTMITDQDGVLLAILNGITAEEFLASPDNIVLDEPIDLPVLAVQPTEIDLLL